MYNFFSLSQLSKPSKFPFNPNIRSSTVTKIILMSALHIAALLHLQCRLTRHNPFDFDRPIITTIIEALFPLKNTIDDCLRVLINDSFLSVCIIFRRRVQDALECTVGLSTRRKESHLSLLEGILICVYEHFVCEEWNHHKQIDIEWWKNGWCIGSYWVRIESSIARGANHTRCSLICCLWNDLFVLFVDDSIELGNSAYVFFVGLFKINYAFDLILITRQFNIFFSYYLD